MISEHVQQPNRAMRELLRDAGTRQRQLGFIAILMDFNLSLELILSEAWSLAARQITERIQRH